MINKIRNVLKGKKSIFYDLCKSNNLTLSYEDNKTEFEILKGIFYNREYADYFPFYKKNIILDIGAHYGYFSIFAKNSSSKDSKIISIEPNNVNFKHLEKNIIDCNLNNISCYNIAIGDKKGISKLFQGDSPNHSIVDNHLISNKEKAFQEVEVKTLEELIHDLDLKRIDFLKMDCEGAEYSIFKSTPNSIFDGINTISMEFHDLKDEKSTAEYLISTLIENKFKIVKFHYEQTSMNLNYGKLIGTKVYNW